MKQIYILTVFILACTAISAQSISYITLGGAGNKSGSSWSNAGDTTQLQIFINNAAPNSQIWIGKGTYFPIAFPANCPSCNTNRFLCFEMKNKVSLYGGFAGNETSLAQRNIALNETILSGEIGRPNDSSDNTYHVLLAMAIDSNTVLDGLTLKGANANLGGTIYVNGQPVITHGGAGLHAYHSTLTITHCLFTGNYAVTGGGMYADSSNMKISFCSISKNGSMNHVGGGGITYGGVGMHNLTSNPVLTNCVFLNNGSNDSTGGAGIENVLSAPMLRNCVFAGNSCFRSSTSRGAGVNNYYSSPTLINCVFYGNVSGGSGTAINNSHSSPILIHCTFANDSCSGTGATELDNNNFSHPQLYNCIIYNSSNGGFAVSSDGGSTATPPTTINPSFINLANAIGPDSTWGTGDDGLQLSCHSLLRNIGNVNYTDSFDILGASRYALLPPDMGAYENTSMDTALHVTISGSDTVCPGPFFTYTAMPTDSNAYRYAWHTHGLTYNDKGPWFAASFSAIDTVYCIITAKDPCNTHQPATSNKITIAIQQSVVPTITISADTAATCANAPIVYTVNTTNGGPNPSYIWTANGTPFVSSSNTFIDSFTTGPALVSCTLVSSLACANPDSVSSIIVRTSIIPAISPLVTVFADKQTICSGEVVHLTSTYSNGGSPTFQWLKNGTVISNATASSDSVSPTLTTSYTLRMTSTAQCASPATVTSAGVTITVNPTPATPAITQAGNTLTSSSATGNQWLLNGDSITGANSQSYTATQSGNYTVTVTNGNGCSSSSSNTVVITISGIGKLFDNISIYPNPATTELYINTGNADLKTLRIYNIAGQLINQITLQQYTQLILRNMAEGTYIVEIEWAGQKNHYRFIKM